MTDDDISNRYQERDQPSLITTGSGKSIALPCSATPPDFGGYVLEWKKDGDNVYTIYNQDDTGHSSMGYAGRLQRGENSSLIINPVHLNDKGTYWCIIKSLNRPATNPTGRKVLLEVQVPPSFVNPPPSKIYKKVGDNLKLRCHAEGIPPPRIYWRWKSSNTLVENGTFLNVEPDGTELHFLKLLPEHEKIYTCVATNAEGSRTHDVQLLFARGVYFDEPLKNSTALDGNTYAWKCHAKAEPGDVKYEWYFGELKIVYAGGLGLRSSTEEAGVLRISPVLKEDIGWYKCKALNGYGQAVESSGFLDVQYKPEILTNTPVIQHIPLGLIAQLTCNVDANPPVNYIKWTKNGKVLPTDSRLIHTSGKSVIYNFKKVTSEDSGAYTCQAYNTIGDSNIYEMHAIVAEPPYFKTVPLPAVRVNLHETYTLECSGGGDPKPTVIWVRADGKKFPENRFNTEGETNLIIKDIIAEDHGCYDCIVNNTIAALTKQTCLFVENSVPQPPVNITVITGAFDAKISWNPGYSSGHDQTFSFKYREKDSGSNWSSFNVSSNTQYIVTRLQPETEYEFMLEPQSEIGQGFASPIFVAKTKGYEAIGNALPTDAFGVTYFPSIHRSIGPKPDPPLNFAMKSSHQSLTFVWDEPSRFSPVPTRYYSLEYRENPSVEGNRLSQKQQNTPSSSSAKYEQLADKIHERQIQINGAARPLEPGHTYDFRVRAHAIAAMSDPSNSVTYTIPGVSNQMALIASVTGGLLFFVVFLIVGLLCYKFSRSKSRQKSVQNGKIPYANGHQNRASMLLDDNHGFTTASKKLDGSGFIDVPAQSGKSSLATRFKSAAKRHLTLSKKQERRTNWEYRNSQTSETLGSIHSTTNDSLTTAGLDPSRQHKSSSTVGILPNSHNSDADGLINYLHDRAGGSISRGNKVEAVCNSINTLLKRFQSDTWQNANRAQHRHGSGSKNSARKNKQAQNSNSSTERLPPLAVTPLGDAGYLFRLKTQYDRDQLMGTISALREQQQHQHVGKHQHPNMSQHHHHHHIVNTREDASTTVIVGDEDDYAPCVQTLANSFNVNEQQDDDDKCKNNFMQISDADHVTSVADTVRYYENVYCSAAAAAKLKLTGDNEKSSTDKLSVACAMPITPSSSSSGIGSHENVGGNNNSNAAVNNLNPVSLMFREMYIMNSGPVDRHRDLASPTNVNVNYVDTLDNDVRFQRLREEYRQSRRSKCPRNDNNIAESPVL